MIKKIQVDELEVGMFVTDVNAPWFHHPFLTNNHSIKSGKDIDALLKHGVKEVYIDTDKGRDSRKAPTAKEADRQVSMRLVRDFSAPSRPLPVEKASPKAPPDAPMRAVASLREEMPRARALYTEARVEVHKLLTDVRLGKMVDGESAARVVDGLVASIFRNADALTNLTRLKNFDEYTYHHSLNVAVLCIALGRNLGLVKEELRRLGIGAILHDVGKMCIPNEILNKPGAFTSEEYSVMKTHTFQGAKLLLQSHDVDEECSAVALNHHERFGGNGYPRGTSGMGIGKFGLISAIADVYDAMTSKRVYNDGMPSHRALQKIYEWSATEFNPIYVQKFIQCVGIYPVGTLLKLDTGETALVVAQNRANLLRPFVRVVTDANGVLFHTAFDVDLRESDQKGGREFKRSVADVLDPVKAGIDVESAFMLDEAVNQ